MKKRYVISDIHGNARAFIKLLDYVDPNPEELVILGDLCNRGLDTWGVFEECSMLLDEGAHIIVGNHDIYLMKFLNKEISDLIFSSDKIGGITTIKSIEIAKQKYGEEKVNETISKVLGSMIPYLETDKFIFVHAGIHPRVPFMDKQDIYILTQGCKEWKNPHLEHCYEQTIVFGHTPTPMIHRNITTDDARIWYSRRSRKMGVDTGAGFGMRLTLADLEEGIAYAYDFSKRDIIEYRFKRRERI